MEKEAKKPKTKAEKELIAGIIWLIAGVLFAITGGIMVSFSKQVTKILGIVVACCAVLIIGIGIYMVIKNKKLVDKEKAH